MAEAISETYMVKTPNPITHEKFDAALFDLDGVITDSATIHASCWKLTFDEFLKNFAEKTGSEFRPFDPESDYLLYVDGKPRYQGVRDFLASRNISLEEGQPDSPSSQESIYGIGNRKNELVTTAIKNGRVKVYQSSVKFVEHIIQTGIRTAIVSSSRNCKAVLDSVGIACLFPVRVDGRTAAEKGLEGKPSPEYFLEAADLLEVRPDRAAVIEDAISGVQAGRNGKFGLVIGIARKGNEDELLRNGADIVVRDLGEFTL